jgi:hypothetical protein
MTRAMALVGVLGDVFWDLQSIVPYAAKGEIHCRIYVMNTTDIDQNYMLLAKLTKSGQVLSEFPIMVDDAVWFPVDANGFISLLTSLVLDYTDCVLTVHLYEESTNDETDSVSTTLSSSYLPQLPGVPQVPVVEDWLSMIITVMIVVMMMSMMSKALKEERK